MAPQIHERPSDSGGGPVSTSVGEVQCTSEVQWISAHQVRTCTGPKGAQGLTERPKKAGVDHKVLPSSRVVWVCSTVAVVDTQPRLRLCMRLLAASVSRGVVQSGV
jgi:hypothetical protein